MANLKFHLPLYATESAEPPRYVDDDLCRKIGEIVVDLPRYMLAWATAKRRVKLTMRFGMTHVTATACNQVNGEQFHAYVEFQHTW